MHVCVCVCVCMVTDFSAEDKASGVKFFSSVHRRPRQGIIFVKFAPRSQKKMNRRARGPRPPACKHYRRDVPT